MFISIYVIFQSTLPRREWHSEQSRSGCQQKISIHTPTKGVTTSDVTNWASLVYFNPHSHEGSDKDTAIQVSNDTDFNPHSHEGSDFAVLSSNACTLNISIHTPTKGVTDGYREVAVEYLFQSTLPRREWHCLALCLALLFYFNPHSHEGSDSNINQ